MNKKVLLRAPTLTLSGYGTHARQIYKWLESVPNIDLHTELLMWGNTTWNINQDSEDGLIRRIINKSNKLNEKYNVSFQLQLPNEWDPSLAYCNVGMTALVESDICNPKWLECMNKMDLIIVPSQFTKDVINKTGTVITKIKVVPEAFLPELMDESIQPLDLNLETDFNFLIFGQLTGDRAENDRKNLYNTIKYFCEAFKNDKNVGVIIKANGGRYSEIDKKITENKLLSTIKDVRKGLYPKFYFLHGLMDNKEVAGLYKVPSIKALASFHRGEGFCLPMLDAAVAKIPIISTDWSGQLDYLNKGKYIKVDYDLKEVPRTKLDGEIWIPGSKWAEVRPHAADRILKKFRQSPEIPKQWANELGDKLKVEYSLENVKLLYNKAIEEFNLFNK